MIKVNTQDARKGPPGVSIKAHLKQHPKLMGLKIHEDPTAPLDEEDWPNLSR